MEIGIEDCMMLEILLEKSKYHLKDFIKGKFCFSLLRIKLKQMHIEIIKKEKIDNGTSVSTESLTLVKFEIMDGGPIKGE